jgi:hypothetical protein
MSVLKKEKTVLIYNLYVLKKACKSCKNVLNVDNIGPCSCTSFIKFALFNDNFTFEIILLPAAIFEGF